MLKIVVPASAELYDERTNTFFTTKEQTLQLEHSLVSLSKWESKWCKPFLSKNKNLTHEEIIDYVKCMTLTQNVKPEIYEVLTQDNIDEITAYIDAPMTATTFSKKQGSPPSREIITSELIYYWIISLNIPIQCEKWHLNRLLTLIRVCNVKNQPPKKMSKKALMSRNAALNAARRKQMNSTG
jgi:hypothetical protein